MKLIEIENELDRLHEASVISSIRGYNEVCRLYDNAFSRLYESYRCSLEQANHRIQELIRHANYLNSKRQAEEYIQRGAIDYSWWDQ